MATNTLKLKQLEDALLRARGLADLPRPPSGWIRAIRDALGMSAPQLAARLRIARQSVDDLERNEAAGKITLENLDRLARALGCRLVYAVIPENGRTLEDVRRERALAVSRDELARVSHSMKLEDQGLNAAAEQGLLERMADELLAESPRKLWR